MKWSWRIGSIAGIPLRMHATFLALLAFLAVGGWSRSGLAGGVETMGLVLGLFACVILHELGHSLVARSYGIRVREITILPIGGVSQLESMPEDPDHEVLLAIAGPIVSLVIAGSLFIGFALRPALSPWQGISPFGSGILETLMKLNLWLAGFNLLPAFPMDGGRILRGVLAHRLSRVQATRIAANVGQGMAIVFALIGLLIPGWFILIFIALFVYIGAAAEEQQVRVHEQLEGLTARDAMIAPFDFFRDSDTIGPALQRATSVFQEDFPVFGEAGVTGFISRPELIGASAAHPAETPIGAVMTRTWAAVPPAAPLDEVLTRLHAGGVLTLGVEDGGHVVGLVNGPSIVRAVELRQARLLR